MCVQMTGSSLLLPWLRCGGSSAPPLLIHVGVLQLGLVRGDLEHHLGDGYEKAKYHSPAIAVSSAPGGYLLCSLRSLREKDQSHRVRVCTGPRFPIPSFWYQQVASVCRQQRVLTIARFVATYKTQERQEIKRRELSPVGLSMINLVSQAITQWEKYWGENSSPSPSSVINSIPSIAQFEYLITPWGKYKVVCLL